MLPPLISSSHFVPHFFSPTRNVSNLNVFSNLITYRFAREVKCLPTESSQPDLFLFFLITRFSVNFMSTLVLKYIFPLLFLERTHSERVFTCNCNDSTSREPLHLNAAFETVDQAILLYWHGAGITGKLFNSFKYYLTKGDFTIHLQIDWWSVLRFCPGFNFYRSYGYHKESC